MHVTLWHDACHSIYDKIINACHTIYAKIYQCMSHYDMVPMHITLWQDNQCMHVTLWHDACHSIWQDCQCMSMHITLCLDS